MDALGDHRSLQTGATRVQVRGQDSFSDNAGTVPGRASALNVGRGRACSAAITETKPQLEF